MNDEITREQDETTLEQGGFDAISEKLRALYPGQEGRFYGTVIPYFLGGNDPLDGVEVWKSEEGIPHWHYVTYGFTELYQKECEDPEVSGFGFELTFRLKREGEEEPPVWPMKQFSSVVPSGIRPWCRKDSGVAAVMPSMAASVEAPTVIWDPLATQVPMVPAQENRNARAPKAGFMKFLPMPP